MKKNIFLLIFSIFLFSIIIIIGYNYSNKEIMEFNLNEYQWAIEEYPSDKIVNVINDSNSAIKEAKKIWLEEFSMINGKKVDPLENIKVLTKYDATNDCWYIYGKLPKNFMGGVPHAIILSNGEVLALWHDM